MRKITARGDGAHGRLFDAGFFLDTSSDVIFLNRLHFRCCKNLFKFVGYKMISEGFIIKDIPDQILYGSIIDS